MTVNFQYGATPRKHPYKNQNYRNNPAVLTKVPVAM